MKLGIVGLPNVGKSTLFNSLTKAGAESANYPFCTIDPNVGVVPVPDERLDVQRALAGLPEEEADLLRMRGAGLTVAEIARALDLPYETVKKRQQRSLAKLRKLLLTGLVLALAALLAACGYLLLRYFGVLPGYGVNTSQEEPAYVLETGFVQETEEGDRTRT